MDAPKQYLEELRSELGLYPTWLPGDPIELGAYGRITRGKFYTEGRLAQLNVDVVARPSAQKSNFKMARGVRFSTGATAAADAGLVDASAGVELGVERNYAWAFGARGISAVEIENIAEAQHAILEAHRASKWDTDWLLVSELRRVDVLNLLVARARNVTVRVTAKGTLNAADILVGEDVRFETRSEDIFTVENGRNLTPLYGLRQLRGLITKRVKPISRGMPEAESLALDKVVDAKFF